MFNWLTSLFSSKPKYFTGNLPDTRTDAEKQKDWSHSEREITTPADPFSNTQITTSPYFYENQQYTSSCVPHGVGLALAIERKADVGDYTRIAQMFPYRLRSNYPQEGSILQNIFEIYRKEGAPLFTTLPTPMTEAQADAIQITSAQVNEAAIFKGFSYYTLTKNWNDIATLGGIAALGHGVPILIYANDDEWGLDFPVIKYPNLTAGIAEIDHCVCILPNSGFTLNGKQYLTIQDSAWFGGKQLRHLDADFLKARCFAAGYWDKVITLGSGPHPKYQFTKDLHYGDTGADVKAMQQLFIAEGLLANNNATGAFYGLTLAALHAFQNKYASQILMPNNLDKPTDTFGPSSRNVANKLCQ